MSKEHSVHSLRKSLRSAGFQTRSRAQCRVLCRVLCRAGHPAAPLPVLLPILFSILLLGGCGGPDFTDVDAAQARDIIAQHQDDANFVILDIRTPKEFAKGHIEGAVNVDYHDETFRLELNRLEKNRTYLLYCRSGGRTGRTLPLLEELGFTQVIHMQHGLREWLERGFPVVQ